ncbi:uncharacterized protein LOC112451675 isoform X1 [Temnothorax curvispinosus]|uniref:Uncharacterized protein LOC112451675 isoform X1 n=1 Tax=Temnothorax curvispinosus TaxID=300111 RepID=A0A6J1PCU6_9HYME|nr:uncharacterized protein LOC112451675 isoform X1 [Temnothorax curvispinosus]
MVSDIESFAEETNVRRFPVTLLAYCYTLWLLAALNEKKNIIYIRASFSKISEHREATENAETQFMVHDIHEKQVDLESQHCSEQSIQCEKKHPCQGYHLNSPSRVDEIVQHFKTSTMNKCDNSQEESKNNADKAIGISSEERLMTAIAETNSLEGWTKVTDNALREWHDDMEGIKLISQLMTQINLTLIVSR